MGVLQVQDRNLNFRHAVWERLGKQGTSISGNFQVRTWKKMNEEGKCYNKALSFTNEHLHLACHMPYVSLFYHLSTKNPLHPDL